MQNTYKYGSIENPIRVDDYETKTRLIGSKNIVVTHDGAFHNDDMFAGAMFKIYYDEDVKIVRTRNVEKLSTYTSKVQSDYELNRELNNKANDAFPENPDDLDATRQRRKFYFNEVRKESYKMHNNQPIPIVMDNGNLVYFEANYLFDVGLGELDHHDDKETGQQFREHRYDRPDKEKWNTNKEIRMGVKYAASGLVWRKFGRDIIKKVLSNNPRYKSFAHDEEVITRIFEAIDKEIVQVIDYKDNSNNNEYNLNDNSYRLVANTARNEINHVHLEKETTSEKNPFEEGISFIERFMETQIQTKANEYSNIVQHRNLFNEQLNNCTNAEGCLVFDCNFPISDFAKDNPRMSRINYIIMKSDTRNEYLLKFYKKGAFSVGAKPLLEDWREGNKGIVHINEDRKIVAVETLEQAQELVSEFHNYYTKEMDKSDYTNDSIRAVRDNHNSGINENRKAMLRQLDMQIMALEKTIVETSKRVSSEEFQNIKVELLKTEIEALESKEEHNFLSRRLKIDEKYADLDNNKIDELKKELDDLVSDCSKEKISSHNYERNL